MTAPSNDSAAAMYQPPGNESYGVGPAFIDESNETEALHADEWSE